MLLCSSAEFCSCLEEFSSHFLSAAYLSVHVCFGWEICLSAPATLLFVPSAGDIEVQVLVVLTNFAFKIPPRLRLHPPLPSPLPCAGRQGPFLPGNISAFPGARRALITRKELVTRVVGLPGGGTSVRSWHRGLGVSLAVGCSWGPRANVGIFREMSLQPFPLFPLQEYYGLRLSERDPLSRALLSAILLHRKPTQYFLMASGADSEPRTSEMKCIYNLA